MNDICIFQRIEKKYRITQAQKAGLLSEVREHLIEDTHGQNTICSLYLDTPDHLLIRNSIDAEAYKEKLRIRSYGTPNADSRVFLEIKKKYKGIVYKRRVSMTLEDVQLYLDCGQKPMESQIMSEIDYAMRFYNYPKPAMLIAYEREAFYLKEFPNVRLTFDAAVRYRNEDLYLEHGAEGKKLISDDTFLLEIKTDGAMPLWLSRALGKYEIRPSSFSKYGAAYQETLTAVKEDYEGVLKHVCNF